MTADRPTGEQLHAELAAAAALARVSLGQFVKPLFSEPFWKLEQLRIAKVPTSSTIERVRALIEGRPIPEARPSPHKGRSFDVVHRVTDGESRLNGDEIARRRAIAERAKAERLPGETIDSAAKRLRHQQQTIASLGGEM